MGFTGAGLWGQTGTSAGSCPGVTTSPWNTAVLGQRGREAGKGPGDTSPGVPRCPQVGRRPLLAFWKLAVSNPRFKLLNAFSFIKTGLMQLLSTVISIKNLLMGEPRQDVEHLL